MRVVHLELTDFRNYATGQVSFDAGATLLVGSNGQGKTNLVESLVYLSSLSSHRVSADQAMIKQDAEAAIIRARVAHREREFLVEVQLNRRGANRAQVNRGAIRTRDVPRYFSSVVFAPEDLALVRGDPSNRRRFLDTLLVSRSPRMSAVLGDYERVVKQRNTLLKTARSAGGRSPALSTLDLWDERLVELGSQIIEARVALVDELRPGITSAYLAIAGGDHRPSMIPQLTAFDAIHDDDRATPSDRAGTVTAAEAAEAMRASLRRMRRAEVERAVSLVGPHRDDVVLELNGMPARGYASHGESWSFALGLKLSAASVLRAESASGDPVLILDDVFAELDAARRGRLADEISGFEQVLITAAVLDDVPDTLTGATVRISGGRIDP